MKNVTFGMILILVGIVLLLNIFGVLHLPSWNQISDYWPFLLIALGIFLLLQGNTGFFSFFLVLLGFVYSLRFFGVYPFTKEIVIWPSVLIVAGLSFVLCGSLGQNRTSNYTYASDFESRPAEGAKVNPQLSDVVDENIFLSGKEFAVFSDDFRGGELSVMLGGMEVDLRNIKMTQSASLLLRCTLGGIEIYLPPDLHVRVEGTEILGGADIRLRSDSHLMEGPVLSIDYQVTLGGVEIIQ